MMHRLSRGVLRRTGWLEPAAAALQQRVGAVLAPGGTPTRLKNLLNGVWLGHPLHPALTDVPIGAWTVALALDALGGLSAAPGPRDAADAALAIGSVGAVGAAAAGLADWSDTQGDARRLGTAHAALNSLVLGLNLWSLVRRRGGHRRSGVISSLAAYAIAGVSASIGGELVFTRGIGVNHQLWPEPPADFTPVIAAAELNDGALTRVRAGDTPVCLLRDGERILAVEEWCPHLGGPLAEGEREGTAVTCPWHGSQFDLEMGAVLRGPATATLRRFETRVRAGQVEVRPHTAGG